jgi:hypothetical protein
MRFRVLRWIRSDAATGNRQFREVIILTRRLTIGRASDQHLQIADAKIFPNHAVIRPGRGREGAMVIEALTPSGVKVNGRTRIVCDLKEGDEIRVGPAIIVVEPIAKGAPFTLRFRMAEQEGSRLDRLHVLSLNESGLSKRFWSLMLASGVAAIFLLVPMAAALYQPLRPLLRSSSMVPSDELWSPGPLHASHQFIGADCNACHTSPFAPIENVQCTNCHQSVEHHVPVTSADVSLFEARRCGECHIEHAETPSVVSRDQRLCTDCHAKLDSLSPKTELINVTDFGKNHPDFRVTMLQGRSIQDGSVEWSSVRLDVLPNVKRVERSNLRFSHAQHLARKGIKGPNGDEVLQCATCHQPDTGGRLMRPIQMEQQCSRCHSLRFDERDPGTEVPHGDLDGVYRTLVSHFSVKYLAGDIGPQRGGGRPSRRPGGVTTALTRDEQVRARDWAEEMAWSTARDLFEKRVCVDCHEVTKLSVPMTVGFEPWQQWKVEPVKLTQSWMPLARFDHASHKTSDCVACHTNTRTSKVSNDVLMPAIADCRTCHSGVDDRNKLASDCVMCHQFHLPDRGLFDQRATSESEANPRAGTIRRTRRTQ